VQPLQGHDILVCAHASRDARCAACGPPLVDAMRRAAATAAGGGGQGGEGAEEEVIRVWPSSHVGGHRYAGNALVMSGAGDWYGNLRAEEPAAWEALVQGLKEEEEKQEEEEEDRGGVAGARRFAPPLRAHWRGCRGLDEVQQEAAVVATARDAGAGGDGGGKGC
jgi:hypothetical protein